MVISMGHLFKPRMISDINVLTDLARVPQNERLWIFGYGSLMWKTDFEYSKKMIGSIDGYVRKFWQGNVTHRGTPDMPGRVATLVRRPLGHTWGVAFEVVGAQIRKALEHLGMRECMLGGYDVTFVTFHPRECPEATYPALVFNALPDNPYFMGKSPIDMLAYEIVDAEGASGHNIEYVLNLAEYVRRYIPEDKDDHLFGLEYQILKILESRNICKDTLMKSAIARTHLYLDTQKIESNHKLSPASSEADLNNNDNLITEKTEIPTRVRRNSHIA